MELLSGLQKMGFGDTLTECTIAINFMKSLGKSNEILSAISSFSLTDDEITAITNYLQT